VVGFCKHGNELSGSLKVGKFLEQLSDIEFLKKDSSARSYL
jgi:hypothetical protein